MSSHFGEDNIFEKPSESVVPAPPPRVTVTSRNAAQGAAESNVIAMGRRFPRGASGLIGTSTATRQQITAHLSPRVAAATRRAERDYGSLGAVLVYALHETKDELIEHFSRPEAGEVNEQGTSGFVLPPKKKKKRRKLTKERVAFRLEPENAQQLEELLKQCGLNGHYSQVCNEALRRFLNVSGDHN